MYNILPLFTTDSSIQISIHQNRAGGVSITTSMEAKDKQPKKRFHSSKNFDDSS